MKRYIFSADAETIGLYGEVWAVGYVVIEYTEDWSTYEEVGNGMFWCDPDRATGLPEDRAWITKNCLLSVQCGDTDAVPNFPSPASVELALWTAWRNWASKGALFLADCPYPVETGLLSNTVKRFMSRRKTEAPFPLLDLASIRYAKGLDPLGAGERREDERFVHNPEHDARQSARLLVEAMRL